MRIHRGQLFDGPENNKFILKKIPKFLEPLNEQAKYA